MFKKTFAAIAFAAATLAFAVPAAHACGGYGSAEEMLEMRINWDLQARDFALQRVEEAVAAGDAEGAQQAMEEALELTRWIEEIQAELAVLETEDTATRVATGN